MRIAADAAPRRSGAFRRGHLRAAAAEMMFECEIRFLALQQWRSIKDFYAVYAALTVTNLEQLARVAAPRRPAAFEAGGHRSSRACASRFTDPTSIRRVSTRRRRSVGGQVLHRHDLLGSDYQFRVCGRAPVYGARASSMPARTHGCAPARACPCLAGKLAAACSANHVANPAAYRDAHIGDVRLGSDATETPTTRRRARGLAIGCCRGSPVRSRP